MNSKKTRNAFALYWLTKALWVICLISLLGTSGTAFGLSVFDKERLKKLQQLYLTEMNKYNHLTDLKDVEKSKLNEITRLYEAVGEAVRRDIQIDTRLSDEQIQQNESLIIHFDRDPKNQQLVHTVEALNRDRTRNRLFMLKLREISNQSSRPLTLTERYRLNQEIKGMSNELMLQNLQTMEASISARQTLKYETLELNAERLERRRQKEKLKALVEN